MFGSASGIYMVYKVDDYSQVVCVILVRSHSNILHVMLS